MKTIKLIICLLMIQLSFSQEIEKTHNTTIFTSAGTYIDFGHKNFTNDGFNIGVEHTFHWNNWAYVGVEVFHFPKLNELDYTHFIGKFGLNKYLYFGTIDPVIKLNIGYRGGFIKRETVEGVPKLLGWEAGATYFIPNTALYISVIYSDEIKQDNKQLNGTDSHNVKSVFGGVGFKF